MIIRVLLLAASMSSGSTLSDAARESRGYRYADQSFVEFCTKNELTCVLDLTTTPPQCEFSSAVRRALNATDVKSGKLIFEKQCRGYRWRVVGSVQIFEPNDVKSSRLNGEIKAVRSRVKVTPIGFMVMLMEAAKLPLAAGQGFGAKAMEKAPIHFVTPAGSVKSALISAAKQYPKTIWAVIPIEDGYRIVAQ